MEERVARYSNGAWQKSAFVVLSDESLFAENVFECVVTVPNTKYAVRKATLYAPGKISAV